MRRGELYRFALDPTAGSEQQKTRLCVIVRRDAPTEEAEGRNPMTIVAPLTGAGGKNANLLNVAVPSGSAGTTKESLVLVAQIRAVDKKRVVGSKIGALPEDIMKRVDAGLRAVLALD